MNFERISLKIDGNTAAKTGKEAEYELFVNSKQTFFVPALSAA